MPIVLPPPDDLRPWAHGAVLLHSPAPLLHTVFPALASSMLVVRLTGQVWMESFTGALCPLPPAALIAPSTRFTRFVQHGNVQAVGLVLKPVCLAALLQGSAAGWADRFVSLDDLPHRHWWPLVANVHGAANDRDRVHWLFTGLRAVVGHAREEANRRRLEHLGGAIVQDLPGAAGALGLSVRQLQRQCQAGFGLTPKQLQTLTRLRATLLSSVLAPPQAIASGAGLALDQGYFDQSHLGRDMRRLVGTSLTGLHSQLAGAASAYWPVSLGPRLA